MSKSPTHTDLLAELSRKAFPRIDNHQSKILAVIANEGPQTIYDLKNMAKGDISYSTLHGKVKDLETRSFLTYTQVVEKGRAKFPYELTFRGRLASLTSPITDLSKLTESLVNEFHIGATNVKALRGILNIWFYGLAKMGIDLEATDFSYTSFEQSFSLALTNVLGRECLLRGIGFFAYLKEIGLVLDRDEEEALHRFLFAWIQFEKVNSDFWLRMLEINLHPISLKPAIAPAITDCFPVSNNPPATLVFYVQFPGLRDMWPRYVEEISKGNVRELKALVDETCKEAVGIPGHYCQAMCLDGYCRREKKICPAKANNDPNQIWKCKLILESLMSPDVARTFFAPIYKPT